jgi:hypothetical protein
MGAPWGAISVCMYVCIRVSFVYASDMKYSCRQGKAG